MHPVPVPSRVAILTTLGRASRVRSAARPAASWSIAMICPAGAGAVCVGVSSAGTAVAVSTACGVDVGGGSFCEVLLLHAMLIVAAKMAVRVRIVSSSAARGLVLMMLVFM